MKLCFWKKAPEVVPQERRYRIREAYSLYYRQIQFMAQYNDGDGWEDLDKRYVDTSRAHQEDVILSDIKHREMVETFETKYHPVDVDELLRRDK